MAFAPAPAPEPMNMAPVELAEVPSLVTTDGYQGRADAEDSLMPHANMRVSQRTESTQAERAKHADLHLPTLGVVARVVAPTLGGVLLGGFLVPAWVIGSVAGGALGLLVALARDREVANTAR